MYNNPYINTYNPQPTLDRINNQMAELEKMKQQLQQPMPQPTNLTQNFQIAPSNSFIKYSNSIDDVQKEMVLGDTPFFSKDMSIVWVKNTKNEIKTYELKEIIQKDDKDILIESLQSQINEMKGILNNAKSINGNASQSIKDEKPTNVSTNKPIKTK